MQNAPDDDPPPQAPQPPGIDDCCRSGCVPCVFDLYDDALQRYRERLAAWEARRQARAAQSCGE